MFHWSGVPVADGLCWEQCDDMAPSSWLRISRLSGTAVVPSSGTLAGRPSS